MIQVLIAGALGLAGTVAFLGYSGHITGKQSSSSSLKPAPRASNSTTGRAAAPVEADDLRSGLSAQERQQLREQLRGHWQAVHPGMRLVGTEATTPTAGSGLIAGPESRRTR